MAEVEKINHLRPGKMPFAKKPGEGADRLPGEQVYCTRPAPLADVLAKERLLEEK